MENRDRVLAAIERKKPDRPPFSLGFTAEALESMRQYLDLPESQDVLSDVLDELDDDMRWISIPFVGPKERSTPMLGEEGTDFWGIRYSKAVTPTNVYFEFAYHPLANAKSVAEIDAYDWPSLDWWDYLAIKKSIKRANRKNRRALLYFAGGCFETPWYLRGLEQFLMDLYLQPEIAEAICRHVEKYYKERALRVLDAADGEIDVIGSGGDIGEQQRMMLDPDMWRKLIKPYTGTLISTFKKMGLKTFYHSDGSIVPVIDDLIDLGLDLLDPIQVTAAGMRPEELFPKFGDRLSFHGAIDEVDILPVLSAEEVYRETQRVISILGKNGGHVVSATHMIQGDTPPENVFAMIRAIKDYRYNWSQR